MSHSIEQFVNHITALNRAWKVAQSDSNPTINSSIANGLKLQKANWQIELLRAHPDKTWLVVDEESDSDEEVYSVRFVDDNVLTSDGDRKWNAEHIPLRIVETHLTERELIRALYPKT